MPKSRGRAKAEKKKKAKRRRAAARAEQRNTGAAANYDRAVELAEQLGIAPEARRGLLDGFARGLGGRPSMGGRMPGKRQLAREIGQIDHQLAELERPAAQDEASADELRELK